MTPEEIQQKLAEFFHPDKIGWKPQSAKGNRALAVAYIDARDVMDRLDAAVGASNWATEFQQVGPHSVECRLSVRINGEWVRKTDVGSTSDQPDDGDKLKAAYSDALKRAAVQWGIGRYLYSLPAVWCDFDPQKKQFSATPRLPDWAIPKAAKQPAQRQHHQAAPATEQHPPAPQQNGQQSAAPKANKEAATVAELFASMDAVKRSPKDGAELVAWLKSAETQLRRLVPDYHPGELGDAVAGFLRVGGLAGVAVVDLARDLGDGWNRAKEFVKACGQQPAKAGAK